MIWGIVGWVIIGISILLLAAFTMRFKGKEGYRARYFPQIERLNSNKVTAIERGSNRALVLGHSISSWGYPGLGLNSLTALPGFLDPETLADGNLCISGSTGSLILFAHQIIENRYLDGFSPELLPQGVEAALLGPTPFSYTVGLMRVLSRSPEPSLMLMGNFGPEASLWCEVCSEKKGHVFASAGTITSQAALFTQVNDLLIGENSFILPGLIYPGSGKNAGWLVEDILRIMLILFFIVAAILKVLGVL